MSKGEAWTTRTLDFLRERDGDNCGICGLLVDFTLPRTALYGPSVEHVIRKCDGGSSRRENLVIAHKKCNTDKGSKDNENDIERDVIIQVSTHVYRSANLPRSNFNMSNDPAGRLRRKTKMARALQEAALKKYGEEFPVIDDAEDESEAS